MKAENNVINTKLRRVEGENVLKVCLDKMFFSCVKSPAIMFLSCDWQSRKQLSFITGVSAVLIFVPQKKCLR